MIKAKTHATYEVKPEGACYVLYSDALPLSTPAGRLYALPTAALAEAVADEWRAQTDKVMPSTMPLTQLAATALDILPEKREQIVAQLAGYGASELLCHRAELPPALARRQQEVWQPLLDWCAFRFDALLRVGAGIMPLEQSADSLRALHGAVAGYDDFRLVGLSCAVDVTGSLVLGLALAEKERSPEAIFQAAELDAHFQAEAWGPDPAVEAKHRSIRNEIENCARWFELLGD